METFLRDLRYGFRMLLKRPGFTVVAVVALALGIGANSAIFTVVNAVMLRPLPYADPARLVSAQSVNSINPQHELDGVSPADFWDWTDQSQAFAQLAGRAADGAVSLGGLRALCGGDRSAANRLHGVEDLGASVTLAGGPFEVRCCGRGSLEFLVTTEPERALRGNVQPAVIG